MVFGSADYRTLLMRRRIADLFAVLMLLASGAVIALWIHSTAVREYLEYNAFQREMPQRLTWVMIVVERGGLGVLATRMICDEQSPAEARDWFAGYFKQDSEGWRRVPEKANVYPQMPLNLPPPFAWGGIYGFARALARDGRHTAPGGAADHSAVVPSDVSSGVARYPLHYAMATPTSVRGRPLPAVRI